MGYDYCDSFRFPFDFELNGIPFGSKLKGKLSPRSYPIQCERNWKYSFRSVGAGMSAIHKLNVSQTCMQTISRNILQILDKINYSMQYVCRMRCQNYTIFLGGNLCSPDLWLMSNNCFS